MIPMVILDFLCIKPFNDGNDCGELSDVAILLERTDYHVGKYISLEKLIKQTQGA